MEKMQRKQQIGNYIINVKHDISDAAIEVYANDNFAVAYADGETQNTNVVKVTKALSETERENVYAIKVISEVGTEEEHTLTITKLSGDNELKEIKVAVTTTKEVIVEGDAEGETKIETVTETNTYNPILRMDGIYYLKTARTENVNVTGIAKDERASVKI